ncbi:MAG: DUF485 domain-containing protein [Actinomycetota bacterium]|nr:DUF485 domain-containing protein [Actinomycetota bacterium]
MSVSEQGGTSLPATADPWVTAQRSPEFVQMRKKVRWFVFPMTAFFLLWYFAYVVLAAFAPHFMAIRVAGNINVGLIIGLLQFVSTFAITTIYVAFANKNIDPPGTHIREQLEAGAR